MPLRRILTAFSIRATIMLFALSLILQSTVYALDDQKPSLQSSEITGAVIRLTYDEPLDVSSVPDVNTMYVKVNQEAVPITGIQLSGSSVFITLLTPPLPAQPVVLTYLPGQPSIRDTSGNTASSLVDYTILRPDNTPPLLMNAVSDGMNVTLQYNELLDAASVPSPESFVLKVNGIARAIVSTSINGAGLRLTVAEQIGAGQTVQLTYLHGTPPIRDLAGNDAANIYESLVSNPVQAAAPEVVSASVNGTQLQVTFNQNLNTASVPPAGSFTVTADSSPIALSSVALNGPVLTLSLYSPVSNNQSVKLGYTAPAVNALLGVTGVPIAAITGINVMNRTDSGPPQLTEARMNGAYVQLVYNEPLLASSVPGVNSFSVFVEGQSKAVSAVTIAGQTVSVQLESGPPIGSSSIEISYTVPAINGIQDSSGNLASGLVLQPVYSGNDLTAPHLISVLLEGKTLILTYDEPLNTASVPSAGSFRVSGGSSSIAVSNVAVAANEVRLTLSGNWNSSITLSYTQPSTKPIKDISGNSAASVLNWLVGSKTDQTPPVLTSAIVNKTIVKLTYSEALRSNTLPTASQFVVTVGGYPRTVSSVSQSGTVVTLSLASAVTLYDVVKVSYTPAAVNPIQDLSGNKAAALSLQAVTNQSDATVPTLVSVSMTGTVITLVYSKALDSAYVPPASSFSIYGSGYRSVTNVSVSGTMVMLIVNNPLGDSESISISYSPPYDGKGLQDMSGNLAASLYSQQVRNGSDIMAPIMTSASAGSVSSSNPTIILTYNETLNSGSIPYASQFTVKSGETTIPVSRVTISGTTVTLTLQSSIKNGQSVTLSYSPGYTNSIKDKAGNQAAAVSNYTVKWSVTPITVTSAQGHDRIITLTFSKTLDESVVPETGDFAVTANGSTRNVTEVNVDGYTVELTLDKSLGSSPNVRVSYTPGTDKLQDEEGYTAAAFSSRSVAMAQDSSSESGTNAANGQAERNLDVWDAPDIMLAAGDALQTTETTPQGESLVVYTLDNSRIANALQEGNGKEKLTVGFSAAAVSGNGSAAYKVRIPAVSFQSAAEIAGAVQFMVATPLGAYTFPADVVDAAALADQLKVPSADIYVGIVIRQAGAALAQEMTTAAQSGGLEVLGAPVSYKAMVEASGRTFPLQSFNQYIHRQLYIGKQVTVKDTTVVWYDPSSKRLAYVPALLQTEGNQTSASIMHMTNGTYMAVKTNRVFTDMASHWAAADVQKLASKLIVSGVSATAFEPNKPITKAEFVTMLTRALGLTDSGSAKELPYLDVSAKSWFHTSVLIAYESGIIDPADRFKPNRPITRAQMAVMAYRAVQAAGQKIPITNIDRSIIDKFTDLRAVSPEERNAIIADVKAGIMSGSSQTAFMPEANASRAQAAVILGRLLRYAGLMNG